MVQRLAPAFLLALSISLPWQSVSAQFENGEKHYRQAAWSFYLQQPAQALETLQLAPEQDKRAQLLEAGLYLQLNMPQHATTLLEDLLLKAEKDQEALPQSLRNIALLQLARYQLELGDKPSAKRYLSAVSESDKGEWLGQQQLLNQLVNWPDISIPNKPDFTLLAMQPEMPYIVSNQALALARAQKSDIALQWLAQLKPRLNDTAQQSFWSALFSGQWRFLSQPEGFVYPAQERQALADYIGLTQAQLHIERQEFAAADVILANFAADSALSGTALSLYSHILTEQRHIPALLAVLQQQIKQQPFSKSAWQAATRIGEQLERALQPRDALGAYHWAEQYYEQQVQLIQQQARPLQVSQLQQGGSQWQQLQLSSDNNLHRLQQDVLALQQQLADAPIRQQRLAQLQQVTEFKLVQQQQLLRTQLPQLTTKLQQLQQQFSQLQQHIELAQQHPMDLALWQGQPYEQLSRLEQAEQRLPLLKQSGRDVQGYAQRLQRLRSLLQWQYSNTATERNWQRTKQLQILSELLSNTQQQLTALTLQGDQTARLQQVQHQLAQLSASQQQLNLALLSRQQQLLAELNQQLQQKLQQQLAGLTELKRHNKESMARVMEKVLLTADTTNSGATL